MSDDRVERVARAMCAADGKDPDAQIETGEMENLRKGGAFERGPKTILAWEKCEPEARRFIAALDAANGGASR